MEKLNYSLWAILVCLAYFFIFHRLYQNAEKNEQKDIKDINYFSYAILLFFCAAALHLIADIIESRGIANIIYEEGLFSEPKYSDCKDDNCVTIFSYLYYFLRTVISAANNIFLLLAIPFIQLDGKETDYQGLIVKHINDRIVIWFIVSTELAVLALVVSLNFMGKLSPLWLLAYDSFISTVVIALLAWFINTAFDIRNFKYLKWIALFTFALMLATQILQFFPFENIPPEFNGAISSTYKTILIGLFLILLYTFQKKQKAEIIKQEIIIPSENISLHLIISSNSEKSGLNSRIILSVNPFKEKTIDFSSSRTLTIVMLKLLYNKKHNGGGLKVQPKNDKRNNCDFTYQDMGNICERLAEKTEWLKSGLQKSLFKTISTNCYEISIPLSNIKVEGEEAFIQELLKEARFELTR